MWRDHEKRPFIPSLPRQHGRLGDPALSCPRQRPSLQNLSAKIFRRHLFDRASHSSMRSGASPYRVTFTQHAIGRASPPCEPHFQVFRRRLSGASPSLVASRGVKEPRAEASCPFGTAIGQRHDSGGNSHLAEEIRCQLPFSVLFWSSCCLWRVLARVQTAR